MCGIVGIASNKPVCTNIIESLKKLEYRGYDSAGIATIYNGAINEKKCTGRVNNLEKIIFKNPTNGVLGIGHVRWATHGVPNEINAHPHSSEEVSVVHNGIIENSNILKKDLETMGYKFKSQTDTEVITLLLTDFLKDFDLVAAINKTLEKLNGSFALGILFKKYNNIVVGARRGSPLAVGYGHNENFLGSDSYALKSMTNKITYLDDGDVCILSNDKIDFYNQKGKKINKQIQILSKDKHTSDKGDFKDFMSKEINEQDFTSKTCIKEYVNYLKDDINLYNFPIDPKEIKKIILIGCGTAYHACLSAKHWFEELTNIEIETDVASEFRYRKIKFNKKNLYVFISQSGETADTFAALELCKKNKVKTCAIVNVVESSIARSSDFVLPIHAGPEIGVASTKAFSTQLVALMILTLSLAKATSTNPKLRSRVIQAMRSLPDIIMKTLELKDEIIDIAPEIAQQDNALFLGRGMFYPIAMEGALKLKEISYIHAEAYPAGELKHGPLALIDEHMPVIAIAPEHELAEKLVSNLEEVKARGGALYVFGNAKEKLSLEKGRYINMPECDFLLTPILYTIPLQILSYEVALIRGTDIDQPRNLAKSVTVE